VEVPAPLESLDGIDVVWYPVTFDERQKANSAGLSAFSDYLLKIGMAYSTESDAVKRAEAMMKFKVKNE